MAGLLKFNPTDLFNEKLRIRKLLKNNDVIQILKTAHLYGELKQSYTYIGQPQVQDYSFQALLAELEK